MNFLANIWLRGYEKVDNEIIWHRYSRETVSETEFMRLGVNSCNLKQSQVLQLSHLNEANY